AGDPGLTVLGAGLGHLRARGWAHDYQGLVPADGQVTATAEAAVAGLLRLLEAREVEGAAARGAGLEGRVDAGSGGGGRGAAEGAADGAVPLPRLLHELGAELEGHRFVLANGTNDRLEMRQWSLREPRQYLGWHGAGGLGYGAGATIGCALACG